MNIADHQDKEKNEKTGKRKAGVERRQANFKEAACYPSAVVQGAAWPKNGLRERSARDNWALGKANSHFDPIQTGQGPHHHVEAAVDWYSSILLALHLHTTYTTEISHFTIQKDRSQYVF